MMSAEIKIRFIVKPLLVAVAILSTAMHVCVFAQAYNFPEREGIELSPRWVDNLMMLNHYDGPIPSKQQMLYKWAETHLAMQPENGFSNLVEYSPFQKYCAENQVLLLGGPMLGNITDNAADIWMRTARPDQVTVKVEIEGDFKSFGPVSTTKASELSGVVHISGLKPGEQYPYRVFVGDKEAPISKNAQIRTLDSSGDTHTRIVFGSCFHRWGLGNGNLANTIINRSPAAFFTLGDIAAQDKMNLVGWHTLDYLARDMYPAWQNLVSRVPMYAIWDDHDYFGNDLAGTPEGYTIKDKENVWKVFRYSWNNPSYGLGEEGKGIFFRTRIGPADIIMLDGRYFREKGNYLGDEQFEWLKAQLLDCKGPFILLGNGTMWSDYVSNGKDSWDEFDPEAKEKIFSLIEEHHIGGVLLISGDRHGSRGFVIPRPTGFNFHEFQVASLGGLGGPPATMPEWENQFYGISGGYAFGEFTFDTSKPDPTVTFKLIGDNGKVIFEQMLKRSALDPSNFKQHHDAK